jgi:hypothetical protein
MNGPLEQVSLSSSSPAFCPNSPAFRRTHPQNCSRCNNNNKYGGQDLDDKPDFIELFSVTNIPRLKKNQRKNAIKVI